MDKSKGLAYCGLACCVCGENASCPGCRSGGCAGASGCEPYRCCRQRGLAGCWECPDFPCGTPMLGKPRVRCFAEYIAERGEESLVLALEQNEADGVIYHYPGELVGDYDRPRTGEEIKELLDAGLRKARRGRESEGKNMLRDYAAETEKRVAFIQGKLAEAHADGVIFGNSGGKDSALVGILCKKACGNTVGVIMPCQSKQNYGSDRDNAIELAEQYGIETATVDLTAAKEALAAGIGAAWATTPLAASNINPRLRMTALYALGQSRNLLVAGTGNRSEGYLGYFTKWGDGAHDFNPISDLTVREVYEFLDYLEAPLSIRTKAPSAGLYDGQTDEKELGLSYAELDDYLLEGRGSPEFIAKVEAIHARTEHKRRPIAAYGSNK